MVNISKRLASIHGKPRQILGFSLDPEFAREVKACAAKRGLSLKNLFREMWVAYQKQDPRGKS